MLTLYNGPAFSRPESKDGRGRPPSRSRRRRLWRARVLAGRILHTCLLLAGVAGPASAAVDCWHPRPGESRVEFIATQAGAPFKGTFTRYRGEVCLDPAQPESGSIDITVDTASVDAGLPEFDDALRGPDFFDAARWPQATFRSDVIEAAGEGEFRVRGHFTLRNITREVEVPFTFVRRDAGALIEGETRIQRLEYDIGLGEWRDTRWVGDTVVLKFTVALSK